MVAETIITAAGKDVAAARLGHTVPHYVLAVLSGRATIILLAVPSIAPGVR